MKRRDHHTILKTLVESNSETYDQIIGRLPAPTIRELCRLLERISSKQHRDFKGIDKDSLKSIRQLLNKNRSTVRTLLNKHVRTNLKRDILKSRGGFIFSFLKQIVPALISSFVPSK